MVAAKTPGNQVKTPRNPDDVLDAYLETQTSALRHLDTMVHAAEQRLASLEAKVDRVLAVLEANTDLLDRARGLLDPGKGVRKYFAGRKENTDAR